MKQSTNNQTALNYSENFKHGFNFFTNFFMAAVISLISMVCFAQDKPGGNEPVQYNYSNSNGDVNNPMFTQTQPVRQQNAQIEALAQQIRHAKETNNMTNLRELEAQMNQLTGSVQSEFINDPSVTGMQETVQYFNENGDGISTIANGPFWAIATQTSNRTNKIYAAVTEYVGSAASDQLKIYVSYNNGVTWSLKGVYNGFLDGARFRAEELDIEPIISGADTLVYAVAGYTYNSRAYSFIGRFNVVTGTVNAQSFSLSLSTTQNYNPRIVSDNSYYTSSTYLYVTVMNDSVVSSNHSVKTRLCVILNPFQASFTQTHRNPGGSGFWWVNTTTSSSSYSYQDVGYFYNAADNKDVVYVAAIYKGTVQVVNSTVYTAWSKDYGVTNAGNLALGESTPISKVRLAFNGGNNTNGAMVYLKDYTTNPAGDVDVRVQNTTTGGFFTNSWAASFLEYTSDTANSCDIQAVKLANNKFKLAYSVKGSKCFYSSNTSINTYTIRQLVNNYPAGDGFGRVRAGYRVTSDSCLSVWSTNTGGGLYSTYGCEGYVGISQNGTTVPTDFSMSQNYPNPFNPVTNIKFSIPQASFVKLVVYDVTGKQVAELVNKQMNAGSFTADFDASHLSSGVYFYRISTDNFTDVKKMMLIK
jgi:hypothetical protein